MSTSSTPAGAVEQEQDRDRAGAIAAAREYSYSQTATDASVGPELSLFERCQEQVRSFKEIRNDLRSFKEPRGQIVADLDETPRFSFLEESFPLRRLKSMHVLQRFRSQPLLEVLNMDVEQREIYFTKAAARFPAYLQSSAIWMSEWRIAGMQFAGLSSFPMLLIYRLGWVAATACYVAHLRQIEGKGAGAWLLFLNHILIVGIQHHVISSGILASM